MLTSKTLFTHRKSEVDFSSKTISLGDFFSKKPLCENQANLDNELVFSLAGAWLASLSTF